MASLSDILKNTAEKAGSAARIGAQKAYGRAREEVLSGLRPKEEYEIDPEGLTDTELQQQVIRANKVKKVQQSIQTVSKYYNRTKNVVAAGEFLLASWPILLAILIICGVITAFAYASSLLHATNYTAEAESLTMLCDNIKQMPFDGTYPRFKSINECMAYMNCLKATERTENSSTNCVTAVVEPGNDYPGNTPNSLVAADVGVAEEEIHDACTAATKNRNYATKFENQRACWAQITCADIEYLIGVVEPECKTQ